MLKLRLIQYFYLAILLVSTTNVPFTFAEEDVYNQCEQAERELKDLRVDFAARQEHAAELQRILTATKAERDQQTQSLKVTQDQILSLTAERNEQAQKLKALEHEVSSLAGERQQEAKVIAPLRNDLQQAEAKVEQLSAEVLDLQNKLESVHASNQEQKQCAAQVNVASHKVIECEEKLASIFSEKAKCNTDFGTCKRTHEEATAKVTQYEQELSKAKEHQRELSQKLDRSEAQLKKAAEMTKTVQSELATAMKRVQALERGESYLYSKAQFTKTLQKLGTVGSAVIDSISSSVKQRFTPIIPSQRSIETFKTQLTTTTAESQKIAKIQLDKLKAISQPAVQTLKRQLSDVYEGHAKAHVEKLKERLVSQGDPHLSRARSYIDKANESAADYKVKASKAATEYSRMAAKRSAAALQTAMQFVDTKVMNPLYASQPQLKHVIPEEWSDRAYLALFIAVTCMALLTAIRFVWWLAAAPLELCLRFLMYPITAVICVIVYPFRSSKKRAPTTKSMQPRVGAHPKTKAEVQGLYNKETSNAEKTPLPSHGVAAKDRAKMRTKHPKKN